MRTKLWVLLPVLVVLAFAVGILGTSAEAAMDKMAGDAKYVGSAVCVNCHKAKQASNDCLTCHY